MACHVLCPYLWLYLSLSRLGHGPTRGHGGGSEIYGGGSEIEASQTSHHLKTTAFISTHSSNMRANAVEEKQPLQDSEHAYKCGRMWEEAGGRRRRERERE